MSVTSDSLRQAAEIDAIDQPVAATFAGFVAELTYEQLPADVVSAAKALICDQLASQLIGSTMPWVAPALSLVQLGHGCKGESTIVAAPARYLAADAAFVNATYGQACELDNSAYGAAGHIGTATIPAALAMGERERIDGRQFIAAIVAGYEVMYRLMASVRPYHNTRGFHSQSIAGPFAAAAAAAKILGLSPDQTTHALAIAGSHSCGPLEYDQSGGEVKRIHAGLAARGGIHSALLAQFGLTGPATIIEGERGFCRIFSTRCDLSQLTSGLGQSFNIKNTWFKIYPATAPVHTSISATARLLAEHAFEPADVSRIRLRIAETSVMHGAGIRQPKDVIGAQFSVAYSVALQIAKGRNDLCDYMNADLWSDPEIVALMDKVEVAADPEARGELSHMATVTIDLADGRSVTLREKYPPGTPPNPASREQRMTKVRELSRYVLPADRIEQMIALIETLERVPDVGALAALLAGERPAP